MRRMCQHRSICHSKTCFFGLSNALLMVLLIFTAAATSPDVPKLQPNEVVATTPTKNESNCHNDETCKGQSNMIRETNEEDDRHLRSSISEDDGNWDGSIEESFIEWSIHTLHITGIENVAIQILPLKDTSANSDTEGGVLRGLFATKRIRKNEMLLSIPYNSLITLERIYADAIIGPILLQNSRKGMDENMDKGMDEVALLVIYLLYQSSLGKESPIDPYLNLLRHNSNVDRIPFLPKNGFDELEPDPQLAQESSLFRELIEEMRHDVEVLYNNYLVPLLQSHPHIFVPTNNNFSLEQFTWMFAAVNSRYWHYPLSNPSNPHAFMAPMADLLNFGPPCAKIHYNVPSNNLEIVSTCDLEIGDKITFWYTDNCDEDVIEVNYGFRSPLIHSECEEKEIQTDDLEANPSPLPQQKVETEVALLKAEIEVLKRQLKDCGSEIIKLETTVNSDPILTLENESNVNSNGSILLHPAPPKKNGNGKAALPSRAIMPSPKDSFKTVPYPTASPEAILNKVTPQPKSLAQSDIDNDGLPTPNTDSSHSERSTSNDDQGIYLGQSESDTTVTNNSGGESRVRGGVAPKDNANQGITEENAEQLPIMRKVVETISSPVTSISSLWTSFFDSEDFNNDDNDDDQDPENAYTDEDDYPSKPNLGDAGL